MPVRAIIASPIQPSPPSHSRSRGSRCPTCQVGLHHMQDDFSAEDHPRASLAVKLRRSSDHVGQQHILRAIGRERRVPAIASREDAVLGREYPSMDRIAVPSGQPKPSTRRRPSALPAILATRRRLGRRFYHLCHPSGIRAWLRSWGSRQATTSRCNLYRVTDAGAVFLSSALSSHKVPTGSTFIAYSSMYV